MQVNISIGQNCRVELREALLIYGEQNQRFVTKHNVALHKDGPTQSRSRAATDIELRGVAGTLPARKLRGGVPPGQHLGEDRPDDLMVDARALPADVLCERRRQSCHLERL